jgi:choloylglycine hydrolase
MNPNVVWVEFGKIDFSEKGKVRKLSLDNNENYSGESSMNFKNAQPFVFAGL